MSDAVLRAQLDYYRRRAEEYDETAYGGLPDVESRIARILATTPPAVATLEIACGTGMWTRELARRTDDLTALDGAFEALTIARQRCPGHVRFVCADAFAVLPRRRYHLVFFSAWLSHVPTDRWPAFFASLRDSLADDGRVVFVDEHPSQAPKERTSGTPDVVLRTLGDGSVHRVVKVFVDPGETVARLAAMGWTCEVALDGDDWVVGTAAPTAVPA